MRTLTYLVAASIDGYIAELDGADPTGGLFTVGQDYLSHIVAHYPETLPTPAREALGVTDPGTRFDTVLEGRRSYEVGLDAGVTDAYAHLRHLVFSTTLAQSPDPGVELVATDPVETVRQLKPVTAGTGIPLFAGRSRSSTRSFTLTDHTVLDSGPAVLTYSASAATP